MALPNPSPTINCLLGNPIQLPSTGEWLCPDGATGAYTITNPMDYKILKAKLPPLLINRTTIIEPPLNPSTPAPTPSLPTLDVKNCRRHQAPPNYTYVWNGYNCQLVALKDVDAYVKQLQSAGVNTTGTGTTSAGFGDIGSLLSEAISAHPMLVLAGVAGLIYMFANKGMKPKSREVVSTTRY